MLLSRILGPDGAPLGNRQLMLLLSSDGRNALARVELTTDAQGRSRSEIDEEDWLLPGLRHLRWELDSGGEKLAATVVLEQPLAVGVNDLGDVVLSPSPLVAAGRVVDDQGAPCAGAHVTTSEHRTTSGREVWRRQPSLFAVTGADGRFEIRGEVDSDRLAITARGPTTAEGPRLEFTRGAADLEYVLVRGGTLVGHVLHDVGIPPNLVGVYLHTAGEPDKHLFERGLEQNGDFVFFGVEPGLYDVHLGVRSSRERFGMVPNVRVVADERTEDPRLNPFDARGLLTEIDLDVRLPGGIVARDVRTWTRAVDSEEPWAEQRESATRRWTTVAPALDVSVFSPGSLLVELPAVAGERVVALSPGIPIEVRVGCELPDHGEDFTFEAYLNMPAPAGSDLLVGAFFGDDDSVTLHAPRAGLARIGLRALSLRGSAEVSGASVEADVPLRGTSVTLPAGREELERALAELANR